MTGLAATRSSAAGPASATSMLLRYARRQFRLTGLVLLLVTCGALTAVAAQYGLKLVVDAMTDGAAAAPGRDAALVARSVAVFLGLLALESVCWRLGGFHGARAVVAVGEDVRLDLFAAVSERSWTFLSTQASGALAARIAAASSAVTTALRTLIWNIVPPATDLIGSVVVLSLVDARIGGALLATAIPLTILLHQMGRRGFPLHAAYHREAASVGGVLADVLGNMATVHVFGARSWEMARLRTRIKAENRAHVASWIFLERLRCWHDAVFWLVNASVLASAVLLWSHGAITGGGVVVAMTLTLRVLAGSREMALSLLGLSQQLGALTEAIEVLAAPEELAEADRPALVPGPGAIEIQGLHYAAGPGCPLFTGLDLVIPAGQRVGIVGPSGAGKSTLLRITQGTVPPGAGRVLVDGQALADHAPESLATAFSVVTQEVGLLQRSVAENLRYGRNGADWSEVLAVSRAVGCDTFIDDLPQGYDTTVGERGVKLSGGQRQRIAVARALLRRAPVLLLDEATSALDTHAEREVLQAILRLGGKRTILAVAHRLSTVIDFDRIIVIENGKILEDGAPDELLTQPGYFRRTWRLQQRGADPVIG